MGRGESLTLSLQAGSRAQNYSLAFTEPFLFDRNITGGVNVFKTRRPLHRPVHAEVDRRASLTLRLPARQRLHADVHELQLRARARHRDQRGLHGPDRAARATRSCAIRCSSAQGGERIISKVVAVHRLQHGRPADLPDHRQAVHAVDRSRRARRQHQLLQADGRGRVLLEAGQPR